MPVQPSKKRRLTWLRQNHASLRIETYSNLRSAVEDGQPLCRIGVRALLPSSYAGGKRNMQQNYQDCMAIVRHCGKPSLLITMTTKSIWHEIRQALSSVRQPETGQTSSPQLKLDELLYDLHKRGSFSRSVAGTLMIEYQKRGLPQPYILVILHPDDRPYCRRIRLDPLCRTAQHGRQPQWETITNSMMHGPFGLPNPHCPCMANGRCKSRCSRSFRQKNFADEVGYPTYKRRNDDNTFTSNGFTFDKSMVIPYNPTSSTEFDCHINVGIASTITAV